MRTLGGGLAREKKRVEQNLKRLFLFLILAHGLVIGGYLYHSDREVFRERAVEETVRGFTIEPDRLQRLLDRLDV